MRTETNKIMMSISIFLRQPKLMRPIPDALIKELRMEGIKRHGVTGKREE